MSTLVFTFLLCFSLISLALPTWARFIDMKVNLGGEAIDGFSSEEEVISLENSETMSKMRFHGDIKRGGSHPNVFKTQRFSRYEDLVLNFPVPDGIYTVSLLFAETWKGAFGPNKRVFDVYLGSTPGGVVKVLDQFDPFRVGGAASGIVKKFDSIATQGGLTVALRPIVQNPQIAGIIITGYSYQPALMEDLPTVTAHLPPSDDFNILSSIGPKLPSDPAMLYDPNTNPKFKNGGGPAPGGPPPPPPPGASSGSLDLSLSSPGSSAASPPSGGAYSSSTYGVAGGAAPGGAVGTAGGYDATNSIAATGAGGTSAMAGGMPVGGGGAFGAGATARVAVPQAGYGMQGYGNQMQYGAGAGGFGQAQAVYRRRLNSIPDLADTAGSGFVPDVGAAGVGPTAGLVLPRVGAHVASSNTGTLTDRPMVPSGVQSFSQPTSGQPSVAQPAISSPSTGTPSLSGASIGASAKGILPFNGANMGAPSTVQHSAMGSFASPPSNPLDSSPGQAGELPPPPETPNSMPLSARAPDMSSGMVPSSSGSSGTGPSQASSSVGDPTLQHIAQAQSERLQRVGDQSLGSSSNAAGPNGGTGVGSFASSGMLDTGAMRTSFVGTDGVGTAATGVSEEVSSRPMESRVAASADVRTSPSSMSLGGSAHSGSAPSLSHGASGMSSGGAEMSMPGSVVSSGGTSTPNGMSLSSGGTSTPNGMSLSSPASGASGGLGQEVRSPTIDGGMRGSISTRLSSGSEGIGMSRLQTHHVERIAAPGVIAPGRVSANLGADMGQGERVATSENKVAGSSSVAMAGTGVGTVASPKAINLQGRNVGLQGSAGSGEDNSMSDGPTPGIHNGNGQLDGVCLENRTHCSCGMADNDASRGEECLFVVNEEAKPMICVRRPCSGKLVCACAPGANIMCKRSLVTSILVTVAGKQDTMGVGSDNNVVLCRREPIEQGVHVLTPML